MTTDDEKIRIIIEAKDASRSALLGTDSGTSCSLNLTKDERTALSECYKLLRTIAARVRNND